MNFTTVGEDIFVNNKKILLNSDVQTVFKNHKYLFDFLLNYNKYEQMCDITLTENELVLKFNVFGKVIKYKIK